MSSSHPISEHSSDKDKGRAVRQQGQSTVVQGATPGTLYLVATPIGNRGDISARALKILAAVAYVAAEDTRRAGQLLALYGIKQNLLAYHDHNEAIAAPKLLSLLSQGKDIALISDAGLPLIADPGHRLVAACAEAAIKVTAVPGANAALMALMLSSLPCDRFYFHGFLPAKSNARRTVLAQLSSLPSTLIFYEAPHRLLETLIDAEVVLGNRQACVARELTKLYEEVKRGLLKTIADHYQATAPRGECVLVIAGQTESQTQSQDAVDALLLQSLQTMKLRDAARAVARTDWFASKRTIRTRLATAGQAVNLRKVAPYRRGMLAERLAVWYLRCKGYRILRQRWRTPVGEIDILAVRGKSLVIVEVKHRATLEQALSCVTPRQQQRLLRALHYAVAALPHYNTYSWRCDLLALAPRRWPRHLVSAWEARA